MNEPHTPYLPEPLSTQSRGGEVDRPGNHGFAGFTGGLPQPEAGVPMSVVLWTLRRFWWAVVAVGLAVGTMAYLLLGSMNASYESQARLLVGQLQGSTDSLRASAAVGATYADQLSDPNVLRRVGTEGHLSAQSAEEMVNATTVTFNDKSRILTIQVAWADPGTAQRLTRLMVAETNALQRQGPPAAAVPEPSPDVRAQETLRQVSGDVTLIQGATVPDGPVDAHSSAVAMLAAVAGALVTFTVLCFWVGRRHRARMRARQSLAAADYLGSAMSAGHARRRRAASSEQEVVLLKGRRAADYGRIAARLEMRTSATPLRSLCVVGTRGGPVAAEAALNLAAAFAASGRQVTLVDPTGHTQSVQLRRPQLTVVQVARPQDETEIAKRLLPSEESSPDELLVLILPSLIFPTSGSWWLNSADAVVLAGEERDPAIPVDLVDAMDAIVRRGGALLGVMLLRDGRPLARLTALPEGQGAL